MIRERPSLPLEGVALFPAGQPAGLSQDERLEEAIEATRQALLAAVSKPMQRELAEQMRLLIGQRSPWKVAQMEKERGIAR